MKSNMLRTGAGLIAIVTALALAIQVTAVRAEEPDPSPGLDGVTVRLCTESADVSNVYCSSPGEVIATQIAETRTFDVIPNGGTMTLPGSFRFTSSELAQAGGLPRAVVYGPIQGFYEGIGSAYFWGVMFRDNVITQFFNDNPTEVSAGALGSPGMGLDLSHTRQFGKDFGFTPYAAFQAQPYYVTIYLDQSLSNYPVTNPGIGTPTTLDGQVWGRQNRPPY